MGTRKKKTDMYSPEGSKKVEYFAIMKLMDDGFNDHQVHKKLNINLYSVRKVRSRWLAEQKEGEHSE